MITGVVVAAVVVLILVGLAGRSRLRSVRRVDQMTAKLLNAAGPASHSVGSALDRLESAISKQSAAPHGEALDVERYRASLSSITLGVVLFDEAGRRVFDNPPAAAFLRGRHGDAVVGEAVDQLTTQALADGAKVEREVQLFGPPRKSLQVVASPVVEEGKNLGVVVLIDDVTERERVDTIRRDFVANISHELRTPLGAISLLAETLSEEPDPAVATGLAARLSSEAHRLTGTIDDLLQLSRIEHGADDDFEPVVLQHIITDAVDRVRAAADQQHVEIGVQMPDDDLVVRGSSLQLASALFNLIDNGVKYANSSDGVLSVRARDAGECVEVVVQDNGIGIPRKDLDRIFERFYRVDRGRSRRSGGTGLGLAIVRHVLVNHGGHVRVESTEGEGTTFTIELPILRPDKHGHHTNTDAGSPTTPVDQEDVLESSLANETQRPPAPRGGRS